MSIKLPITERAPSEWQRLDKERIDAFPLGHASPPYTDAQLAEAFKTWGIPLLGQQYVWESREHAPTRDPLSRVGNVITHFYSQKMGRHWPTESLHPEYGAVRRYEHDGGTREYYCQPAKTFINMKVRSQSDGSIGESIRRFPYTPDILRITNDGIYVEEWKTENELQKACDKHPDRIFKLNDTWHFPERESHFREMGIIFCLRSAEENGAIYVQNLSFLAEHLQDTSPLRDEAWRAIESMTNESSPTTLAALASCAVAHIGPYSELSLMETLPGTFRIEDVYKAIAHGRLFVDLEVDNVLEPSEVIICASAAQLAWVRWHRPVPHSVTEYLKFDVAIGTQFNFRGKPETFTVCGVTTDVVMYTNADAFSSSMSESEFAQNFYHGHIQILSSVGTTNQLLQEIEHIDDRRI
jgi:putative transposase